MKFLIVAFLIWRLLIFIPVQFSILPFANFDGIHYLNIAKYGYIDQARFFPLFPLILKATANDLTLSIVLVSIIFFLAIYFFKKLLVLDFSNQIAAQSLIYLLLFPTSFFFVSIYSEGLFLLLATTAFYFARKEKWFLAVVCASLLTATRFVGIAILPALLYEYVATGRMQMKKFILFLVVPLGLLLYSVFNYYKWHNFLYFIQAQGELGNSRSVNSIVLFPQTIFRYFKILSSISVNSYEWMIALLELTTFVFVGLLLYFAWKKKIRTSYLIFAIVNFAIAISTGTFSALPRYVLTIFPIFIALALVENKILKVAYAVFSPILLFILLMLFSRGYFVA